MALMGAYRDGYKAAKRFWPVSLVVTLNLPIWKRLLWRVGYWRGSRGGL